MGYSLARKYDLPNRGLDLGRTEDVRGIDVVRPYGAGDGRGYSLMRRRIYGSDSKAPIGKYEVKEAEKLDVPIGKTVHA